MALNMCELWFNGIKIASFAKKIQKIVQQLGVSRPDPHSLQQLGAPPPDSLQWYVWVALVCSICLPIYTFYFRFKYSPYSKILVMCQTQASASDLPIDNIFGPRKVPLSKIYDGVIACDSWFTPHQKTWLRFWLATENSLAVVHIKQTRFFAFAFLRCLQRKQKTFTQAARAFEIKQFYKHGR